MPKASKGAYLWLRPARPARKEAAVWIIRDGSQQRSTGCAAGDRGEAERRLAAYITEKYRPERNSHRPSSEIKVADVLNAYLQDKAPAVRRPKELAQRIGALDAFFGDEPLSYVNGTTCRAYAEHRGKAQMARRELQDFSAAINHYFADNLEAPRFKIVMPDKAANRERWLTRSEAARLIWAAWRAKEVQMGKATARPIARHIARFILVGLYTGTRAGAICGAAIRPAVGRGYVDLEAGVFYRRAPGEKETKKRRPTVRLPARLLAHMRRWEAKGLCSHSVVEWRGKAVLRVSKGFASACQRAKLEDVSPHILRHTAITWAMQNGGDLYALSDYFGVTVKVLLDVYGHHHPEHQKRATDAIDRRRA